MTNTNTVHVEDLRLYQHCCQLSACKHNKSGACRRPPDLSILLSALCTHNDAVDVAEDFQIYQYCYFLHAHMTNTVHVGDLWLYQHCYPLYAHTPYTVYVEEDLHIYQHCYLPHAHMAIGLQSGRLWPPKWRPLTQKCTLAQGWG